MAEWNSECGFSLEIFQLFGHFCHLHGLNLVSITSLDLVGEQIWTGSVLEKAGAGEVSEREGRRHCVRMMSVCVYSLEYRMIFN